MKHIKEHSKSRKGDMAEFYAVTWLWDRGYEVFKNCGCDGIIDLIIRDSEGNIKLVDVKTFGRDKRGKNTYTTTPKRTDEQKELGVKLLGFNAKTRELRFIKHRT